MSSRPWISKEADGLVPTRFCPSPSSKTLPCGDQAFFRGPVDNFGGRGGIWKEDMLDVDLVLSRPFKSSLSFSTPSIARLSTVAVRAVQSLSFRLFQGHPDRFRHKGMYLQAGNQPFSPFGSSIANDVLGKLQRPMLPGKAYSQRGRVKILV